MRITTLVLGILGALVSAALAITWLSDASEMKQSIDELRAIGMAGDIDSLIRAAYCLLVSAALGVTGGLLTLKGKGKVAAISVKPMGKSHPDHIYPHACVAVANLKLGALGDADAAADRAVALLDVSGENEWGASALFVKAEVLWRKKRRCDALDVAARGLARIDGADVEPELAQLARPWKRRASRACARVASTETR